MNKEGVINRLTGKGVFTVKDLKGILSKFKESDVITFATKDDNDKTMRIKCCQEEDFIFAWDYFDREDEAKDVKTLTIITISDNNN
jgi:hypothetical protein